MKKKEFIVISIVLAMAILSMAVMHFMLSEQGAYVVVTMDNEILHKYPLKEDGIYKITGYQGGHNELHIEDGKAYISEASCPDKLCVTQKEISHQGEMIVCLPNHIIVKITGGKEGDYDTIAN